MFDREVFNEVGLELKATFTEWLNGWAAAEQSRVEKRHEWGAMSLAAVECRLDTASLLLLV